jgi:hypothetical protein
MGIGVGMLFYEIPGFTLPNSNEIWRNVTHIYPTACLPPSILAVLPLTMIIVFVVLSPSAAILASLDLQPCSML